MQIIDIIAQLPTHKTLRYQRRPLEAISHIVLHHSLTDTGSPEAFARFHISPYIIENGRKIPKKPNPGISYHYVVMRDGLVYKTQEASTITWHAGNYNRRSLGVCMVGNFDNYDPPLVELRACMELCIALCHAYGIPVGHVIGHREVPRAGKTCPGKRVDMDKLRALLKEMMEDSR